MAGKPEFLIKDGKRLDGRTPGQIRPMKIITGFLEKADGSAYVECGGTRVVAGVYGPREVHPKHDMQPNKAIVRCKYDMAAFSVEGERKRPGPDRRSTEISKVVSEAFSSAVFVEKYPKTAIDIFISVIQANASTRVTGVTAASVALADAGIAMRDMITSCSFGKIYGLQDGNPVEVMALDMNKPEDNYGLADVAFAMMPNLNKVVLLQMDGRLTAQEFKSGLGFAVDACREIYKLQKEALLRRYLR